MISVTQAVQDTISKGLAVSAQPRVIAEWNQNRYTPVTVIDNWGTSTEAINALDLDIYPISSLVEPLRPTTGILIAKTNEGVITQGYFDAPAAHRAYTASPDSKYKHWTSQAAADGSGNLDSTYASPYFLYGQRVWTNKIYLCFEISHTAPVSYTVETTPDGTTWTQVAANVVPASDGTVSLYLQGNGTWSTSVTRANTTQLMGVRVKVTKVSTANSYLNMIEMGLRLEQDVTPYLQTYTVGLEMGNDDIVSPMGDISSNVGSVVLSNLDGRFNNEAPVGTDPNPQYRGLIDANTKFTIDVGIDTSAFGGTGYEYVRQGTMYADIWQVDNETAEVSLKDASKFLQEINPLDFMMYSPTIGSAIWQLLDSIGFNSYSYERIDETTPTNIDLFWVTSDQTIWEIIQTLCRRTQTAAYFDAFGVLQIKTRMDAFSPTNAASPAWVLDDKLNGTKQPDIITATPNAAYTVNKVNIAYKPTGLVVDDLGRPILERVWTPDGDLVLRCTGLKADMTDSQTYFMIDAAEAVYWQFSGMVNIRGELIQYDGKEYRYIDRNNQWQTTVLHTSDEQLHVDNDLSSLTWGWQNAYTGKITITTRGYDWTTAQPHDTTIQPWLNAGPRVTKSDGTNYIWTGGLRQIPSQSLMRMQTGGFTALDMFAAPHGTTFGQPPANMGTRFRFNKGGGASQACGIFFYANSTATQFYYVDVVASSKLTNNRKEVAVLKFKDGQYTTLTGGGETADILEDEWIDLDISIDSGIFSIWINGRVVLNGAVDSDLAHTDKLGLVARGSTTVDYEYFYFSSGNWPDDDVDNSSYLDMIRGGYYSDQFFNNGYYRTKEAKRKSGKRTVTYKQRYANRFFDEFGMLVHEVRPFSVTFDKSPVAYSDIFISNPDQIVVLDYTPTPFTAQFTLANATRQNAILNGDDTLTFVGNSVSRQTFIAGRTVQQKDEQIITKTNDEGVRTRGEISLDISSDWIQSEAAATSLGDWLVDQWGIPADQFDFEIFGNPLLEPTDVVAVNFSDLNMTETTHKYFVLKVDHDFDGSGLGTTLTLRRAN